MKEEMRGMMTTMSRWKQRIISLLLVVSMVFGLTQGNVLQVEAAEENLSVADGIIWLAKNEDGSSVSEEFESMVTGFKLDDMVRDALGIEDTSTKVYFDKVDIGNAMELLMNMSKVESMIEDMKTAITNKELMTFNIGSKDGTEKTIAFRSIDGIQIYAGEDNKIYVENPGTPASADDLESMIQNALDNTVLTVEHNGKITNQGFSGTNKTRFVASNFEIDGGVSYKNLLRKWPSVTVSPDSNEKKAGEVTVTIYAAEYEQYKEDKFVKTETIEVWMIDQRVSVNAAAENSDGELVQDDELKGLAKVYSATTPPSAGITSEHYKFVEWVDADAAGYPEYDYTAIMKAKIDNNGNGIHDDLDELVEYTVTYLAEDADDDYSESETVTDGGMPKGPQGNPTRDGYKFIGWKTEDGKAWPAKVTSDVVYYAQWEEVDPEEPEPEFTVTGALVFNGTKGAAQVLSFDVYGEDTNEYRVADPGWAESLAMDGYECIGWYYEVPEGEGQDINLDGHLCEIPFDFDEVWNADENTLELYCEFLPVVEVYNPATGEITNEAKGEATQLYSYTILNADGTEETSLTSSGELGKWDLEEYVPVYDERVSVFNGWSYTAVDGKENTYTAEADFTHVYNTIGIDEDLIGATREVNDNGATYTIGEYKSDFIIDGVSYLDDGTHTYAVDAETSVMIKPLRNDAGDMLYYVDGLKAHYKGREIDEFTVTYDKNCNANIEDVYSVIISRAGSPDMLSDVELVPQYKPLWFDGEETITLAAVQNTYNSEEIYNQVFTNESLRLDYDVTKVEVLYKAQEDQYDVSLNKIFELLEAEGLSALKSQIPEGYTTKEVKPTEDSKWVSLDKFNEKKEMTAQEVTDAYIAQKYEEYKADSSIDMLQFVANVYSELDEVVCNETHHRFGYIDPASEDSEEELRITYKSGQTGELKQEVQVVLDDSGRIETNITVKDVNCTYGQDIEAAIMANVEGVDASADLFVTYDADTKSVRDYSKVGVGTYNVQVAFKGDATNRPAMSSAFKLTVKPVVTTVTVEDLITMEGNTFDKDVSATVNNDAPIVQIIAGIATDELTFGVNTEGSVKDWALEFDDESILVDAWVNLPQSYIDLLSTLDLGDLKAMADGGESGEDSSTGTITPGKAYSKEELEEAIEKAGLGSNVQLPQLQEILDRIPTEISARLGIDELDYDLAVRFVALEDKCHPTDPGFYVNYAATLSSFNNTVEGIEFDKNHTKSSDYGFIVISPMVPIPNRGGVQLYDGTPENHQNIFVYEYDKANPDAVRDLEVAVNGAKLEGETPFYYGFTTHVDLTKAAPSKPGIYFAGYNYTDEENGELRRLGSDSAIIVIKLEEANLTITGDTYEYTGEKHFADIVVTDKDDNEITDANVTVISGTVSLKDDTTTNVTANDFNGTINVDFPDWLDDKWDAFWDKTGYDNKEVIRPSDLITFLEESRDAAKAAADTALDGFETLAMKDAVSDVLDKVNGRQDIADVSSDSLVAKAERVREMLNTSVAYYNKLLEQLEPLNDLDDNASLTFYDLKTEQDKLDYNAKGYYLYLGVITDPDLTVDAGKGLVIIHTDKDYIMYDTHVPYDGEPHTIFKEDETNRSDVKVMVKDNEISLFLDNDLFNGINEVLNALPHTDLKLNEGSDVVVSTVYETAEGKADAVYDKLFELIEGKVIAKIEEVYGSNVPTELDEAILNAKAKLESLTGRLSDKLQAVDNLEGDTRIILYNMSYAEDLQGMPVNAGTYQFYGYDYDVAATRGTLVIEPVYIEVEDGIVDGEETVITKTQGEDDPILKDYSTIRYYSFEGTGTNVSEVTIDTITDAEKANLVNYDVTRTPGETVGKYDMSITGLTLLDESGNYKLDEERVEDGQDFEIIPVTEIPEMSCKVTVSPSTAIIGIHKAEQISLDVEFSDTLGNTSENLKHKYFSHYDVQTSDGVSVGIVSDDDNSGLVAALEEAGTYYIVPMYKGNPEKTYVYDEITKGILTVKSANAPVDPENPDVPNNIIYIWIDTDNSSFVAGTKDNVPGYINPKLKVMLNGELFESEDTLYQQLELSDESYKLVNDETGEEVQLSEIGEAVGKYRYEIICNSIEGYVNEIIPTYITVEAQQLHIGVDIYRKSTDGSEGSVVSLLPIGADANNYEVKLSAWDNIGSTEDNLVAQYIEKYVILDADDTEIELQEALNKPGEYTIKPIEKGNPKNVYGTETDVQTTTFRVSLKVVEVNPVIKYQGNIYEHDRIAWNHPYPIEIDYTVNPADFWADDCDDAEQKKLEDNIDAEVTWTPDVAEENILKNKGNYEFTASGTDSLDDDEYLVNYGTRELLVEQIGAKSKIRPIKDSIFTTVDDTTYKLPAGYDAETILKNLVWSATDDHGNDVTSYITGLKVERQPETLLMRLSSLFDSGDIAMLSEPGTYTVSTVISDDIDSYSSVDTDSITVIVEEEIGTLGLGEWRMDLDSVVYLNYYPVYDGFSEKFDYKNRTGVVIWTGENAPTNRNDIMAGKPNTVDYRGGYQNSDGEWYVRTHEIYAKNLGDMVYIRPYAIDKDGNYVYLDGAPYYSPELFSYDIMNTLNEPDGKQNVCAALLQYGASAQVYFGYDVENLVTTIPAKHTNVKWEDYATAMEYKSEYIDKIDLGAHVVELAATLAGRGEINKEGVVYRDSVLDLAGAIRFSTGFDIKEDVIDLNDIVKAEVLFWNERDFAKIDSLEYKYHNYNFKYDLTKATGEEEVDIGDYRAQSDYIVAKYLGESVYFTCRIELKDGTVYNSGLGYYSPEAFASDHIVNSTGQVVEVCKRIIVYSEMAKQWFLGNN